MPIGALVIAALAVLLSVSTAWADGLPVEKIRLPPGFKIEVFADGLPGARSLALGPGGTIFVGTRTGDSVRAVLDHDGDHRADETITIARGLNRPYGVALREGALYIAEIGRGAPVVSNFGDMEMAAARAAPAPQTSISGGELELRLNVQAVFNIQ